MSLREAHIIAGFGDNSVVEQGCQALGGGSGTHSPGLVLGNGYVCTRAQRSSRALRVRAAFLAVLAALLFGMAKLQAASSSTPAPGVRPFPLPLEAYKDSHLTSVWAVLRQRAEQEPFNMWATVLFVCAVVHTFFAQKFRHWAHILEDRHRERWEAAQTASPPPPPPACKSARLFHFLGEVEVVFGIWVIPLLIAMALKLGKDTTVDYVNHRVSYQEALFVVVIMAISATCPILRLAEQCLRFFARLGGGGPGAWWLAILTIGPLLGSLITEPAAMTIAALLLAKQFYELKPEPRFAYATLGLLFVNVSVGGVLTHFAAPPVLMVAGPWKWTTPFMLQHFGWIAAVGIAASNALYYFSFRKQFVRLAAAAAAAPGVAVNAHPEDETAIPPWVTGGHLLFMGWSVLCAHQPSLLIGGFLFFLAYFEVTAEYQGELQLRSPILVGFFLAGLVIHGGLQQWWIGPVLGSLKETPLLLGAIGLTAFNDNAAITYLATLVPNLADGMKYAVVAGAVTGGGLTVIANAPNPAGQAILNRYFRDGIAPLGLLLGALAPTIIMALCFLLLG